ncbi:MAG: hypothetical protein HOC71_13760 [Candidatus Latescibacteria bacterium]|nr:hypothetical protein [Candidatus Latescibacterota bacterium]
MNTSTFEKYPDLVAQIRDEVIPRGIHFFGHGHLHVRNDSLTFEEAFQNFFQCYYLMEEWGFNPKAYAYPHSSGYFPSTQLACQSAGFIFARGSTFEPDKYFICPDDVKEPENWFFLPSVQIGQLWIYIHNHDEMRPLLEATLEKSAWLIGLYHALGYPDGYCYYPYEDFLKDLDFLEENDFWCSNMDIIACYIKERNNFQMDVKLISSGNNLKYDVVFNDNLDNAIYDTPLTIELTFDASVGIKKVKFEPEIDPGKDIYTITNNKLQINIIPDGQKYTMTLYN